MYKDYLEIFHIISFIVCTARAGAGAACILPALVRVVRAPDKKGDFSWLQLQNIGLEPRHTPDIQHSFQTSNASNPWKKYLLSEYHVHT